MEILGYLASLLMGMTIGALGGGGSILTVPILVYLFSVSPIEATASSLFIVGSTALVASAQYATRGQVNFKSALFFSLPSLVGIYFARNVALPSIPDAINLSPGISIEKGDFILSAFSVLMIAASISMIKKKSQEEFLKSRSSLAIGAQGVGVGFITGFVGAGGGFLILPALVNFLKLPMRVAVGTSLVIIAVNSLFGFWVSIFGGSSQANWSLQLTILGLALVGSFIGARLSDQVDENRLKVAFGWFVLMAGCGIFLERVL